MGRLIQGYWECKYCRAKEISGAVRDCPNCGKPRDDNTQFYMKSKTDYVDEEVAKTINRNPDWICSYCNSLNSDSNNNCVSCGASKEDSKLNYLQNKVKHQKENNEMFDNYVNNEDNYSVEQEECVKSETPNNSKFKNFVKKHYIKFIAIFLTLGVIFGITALLLPRNENVTVTGFSWERSIDVEKFQTIQESGWNLPSGARLKYEKNEIYDYEKVVDHYETKTKQVEKTRVSGYETYVTGYKDLGNGYFEEITDERPVYETYYETEEYKEPIYRQEPIYKTKYYYEIDKWLYERTIKTSGNDKDVYWGKTDSLEDDERTATKHEKYYVKGNNRDGKSLEFLLSYEDWTNIQIDTEYEVSISFDGRGEIIYKE